jgi:hypothetical protein
MTYLEIEMRNGAKGVMGKEGHKKAFDAHWNAIKKGIALIQRHHKHRYMVPGGGEVNPKPPAKGVIMTRHGNLKKSYFYRGFLDRRQLRASYGSDHKPAKWIDDGTGPRWIHARGNKPMRFKYKGKWRSMWMVYHPGITARNTLRRTEKDMAPKMDELMIKALKEKGM